MCIYIHEYIGTCIHIYKYICKYIYIHVCLGIGTRHLESPEEIQMYCSDSIYIYRAVYEVHMYIYMLGYR